MNTIAGKLIYLITGDDTQLKKAMASSQKGMKNLSKTAKVTSSTIARVLSGGALVLLSKKLTDLGADAGELQSKFDVVFKGISNDVDSWIGNYSDAVNRGELATKEYLATLQDIRTGFGDTIPDAARFSEAVVGITNDLSSFSNVSFEETSAAIQSGLAGQFEALRRLGVGLNVAIIDQGKYAQSIGKTWQEMSNLEKQEAVLSGIVSQSGNALRQNIDDWRDYNYELGDAAVTSESFANKVKGLSQQAKDVGSTVGQTLIPHMEKLVDVGSDALEFINEMPGSLQQLSIALAGVAAAFLAGGPIVAAVATLGALAFGIADARDRSDELADSIETLRDVSREYHDINKKLSGDMSELSEMERRQLELKRERLAIETELALTAYSVENARFKAQQARQGKKNAALKAEQQALSEVIDNYAAADAEFKRLSNQRELAMSTGGFLSKAEEDRWKNLNRAISLYGQKKKGVNKAILRFEEISQRVTESELEASELSIQRMEAVSTAARLYKDGLLDISIYESTDKELYDEIIEAASKLKDTTAEAKANLSEEPKAVAKQTDDKIRTWQEWLQTILGVSELASQNGETAANEYLAGFAQQLETDKQLYEALNGTLEGWDPQQILRQQAGSLRNAIEELLSVPAEQIANATEGFELTDSSVSGLLDALKEIEAQMNKINEAGEEQVDITDEVVNNAVQIRDVQKENTATTQDWTKASLNSLQQILEASAALINAMAKARIDALEAQMQAELKALGLNEEKEKNRYTKDRQKASKELQDLQKKAKAETDLKKKNELEMAAAEKAVELDKLKEEEAREEKRIAIKEKYARRQAEIEYRAALQAWKLKKFSIIASGAQAVMNAFATPGGPVIGAVMAAMVGAVTALQLATHEMARPQPPSFAVGAWDVPQDMNANIHAGEMILPKPFAEEFRDGGIGSNVNIQIYTTEQVETEESSENGMRNIKIFVGQVWADEYRKGTFDAAMMNRHGLKKRGL